MTQRNPSKITTDYAVDDALEQTAGFEFDADDRQYIDNQIRGTQQRVVDLNAAIGSGVPGGSTTEVQYRAGASTFGGLSVLKWDAAASRVVASSSGLEIANPAATFGYYFVGAAIAADRAITLPLLTAGDTLVCEAFAQTLSNKTFSSPAFSGTPTISAATVVTNGIGRAFNTDRNPVILDTTDATVTTLDSFTLASNTGVVCSWLVSAIKSDRTEAAAYSVQAMFKNNAGTVALVGAVTITIIAESDAAWVGPSMDVSGTTIRLRVAGKAGTNIGWTGIATCLAVT
jgi:hypothetical protein